MRHRAAHPEETREIHPHPPPHRGGPGPPSLHRQAQSPHRRRTRAGFRGSSTSCCDHCLLIGYADQTPDRPKDGRRAIRYLEDGERPPALAGVVLAPPGQTAALGRSSAARRLLATGGLPSRSGGGRGRHWSSARSRSIPRQRAPRARLVGAMSKFFKALEQADRDRDPPGAQRPPSEPTATEDGARHAGEDPVGPGSGGRGSAARQGRAGSGSRSLRRPAGRARRPGGARRRAAPVDGPASAPRGRSTSIS